jgi:hypothetical protein
MKKWLRRIRGVIGSAFTWAAVWGGVAFILSLAGFFGTATFSIYVVFATLWAKVGLVGGGIFSLVLGIAERRRTFDEMSLPRFGIWGGVGGFLLSLLWVYGAGPAPTLAEIMSTGVLMGLMGGGSAAGSLALARRADDRQLLDAGADVADIGLTEEEKRELLLGN